MSKDDNCFVSGELATILGQGRRVGIAPLQFIKEGKGWRIRISPKLSYYGNAIITIIVAITIFALTCELLATEHTVLMETRMLRNMWILDVLCMLVVASASVFGAPGQMRAIIACLNRVEKINLELLNIMHWPTHPQKSKIYFVYFWMTVTCFLCVADLILLFCFEKDEDQIWINAMYCFYYTCFWILRLREMNFIMIVLHVTQCFRIINETIKNSLRALTDANEQPMFTLHNRFFDCDDNRINHFQDSFKNVGNPKKIGIQEFKSHHKILRSLSVAYTSTCEIVSDIDNAFGLILLLTLGSFFFHLICAPYYIFYTLVQFENESSCIFYCFISYVVVQILWVLYDVINLIMMVEPCHLTDAEMKTTRVLLGKLLRCAYSTDDPLAIEVDQFSKHTYLNQVNYSAMHVIPITRSLLLAIFGSVTTYLAIVIQF